MAGAGSQVRKIRLPNGMVVVPGDWTSAVPLWSTVDVAAGPISNLFAFSYTAGDTVPGSLGPRLASELDTNMQGEGSKLPANEELVIHTMAISVTKHGPAETTAFFPDADEPEVPLPDMLRLQRDMLVQLNIAAVKSYTQTPLSVWPAAGGVYHQYSGGRTRVSDGQTGTAVAYNGSTCANANRMFASPLYVAGGESFRVEFVPNRGEIVGLNLAPESRLRCCIYLDGFRRRPVA